jgi:ribosomal RNA assembly protein
MLNHTLKVSMERIFIEKIGKIIKHKSNIEKYLKVRLLISDEGITIISKNDDAYNEFIAKNVVIALEQGFSFESAMNLKNEDYMFQQISVKSIARPSRLKTIMARIIGEKGRTKEIISEMTGCDVAVHDYNVSVIGNTEDVEIAAQAIRSLIQGSPQASVYAYLERNRKFRKYKEEDLGLREIKKKK